MQASSGVKVRQAGQEVVSGEGQWEVAEAGGVTEGVTLLIMKHSHKNFSSKQYPCIAFLETGFQNAQKLQNSWYVATKKAVFDLLQNVPQGKL